MKKLKNIKSKLPSSISPKKNNKRNNKVEKTRISSKSPSSPSKFGPINEESSESDSPVGSPHRKSTKRKSGTSTGNFNYSRTGTSLSSGTEITMNQETEGNGPLDTIGNE